MAPANAQRYGRRRAQDLRDDRAACRSRAAPHAACCRRDGPAPPFTGRSPSPLGDDVVACRSGCAPAGRSPTTMTPRLTRPSARADADRPRESRRSTPSATRIAKNPSAQLRHARQAGSRAHVQQALGAAVVLGRDRDARLRPDAAVDLEVPLVPARVDRDQVLARDQELHHAAEQRLPSRGPARSSSAARTTRANQSIARRLPRSRRTASARSTREPRSAPEVALQAAHERAEVGEQRDQGARPEPGEARVDARARTRCRSTRRSRSRAG